MKPKVKRCVLWAGSARGLEVMVMAGNRVLHHYAAGNHQNTSDEYVLPGDPVAVPPATMRKYARQTAREIAQEYGVAAIRVHEDTDLLAGLEEHCGAN